MSSLNAQSCANHRSFTHSLLIHVHEITSELTPQFIRPLLKELVKGASHAIRNESEYSHTRNDPPFISLVGDYIDMVKDLVLDTPGHPFGIVFLHDRTLAHLRCGDFKCNPFGLPFQDCHPGLQCREQRIILRISISRPFRTIWVHWRCSIHGEVKQPFTDALVSWRGITPNHHVARWECFLPPPRLLPPLSNS
jgi:hypothetical protein